ncbi:MAG: nicotinate-nucleotide--dimethylbenzimidazole phosphoribosyltransferase, partial [Oscillospiraceae bacterium]|nr:nicotinate-nucleotide--dimethylbenzimidazole phosphoribosyltransferase [Oscillospiraceae bacterium]
GIGNTTAAAALAAVLLNMIPDAVVGRGAGLGSAGLKRKLNAVRSALEVNFPDPNDIPGLLAAVGGLEISAMCGAFLAAAACRKPVIIDGVISAVAALCALRLCPDAADALLPSHASAEPAGREILKALGLHAPLDAGMFLGEGAGAVMLMPLLDLALSLYRSGQDFARLGIEAYRPQK